MIDLETFEYEILDNLYSEEEKNKNEKMFTNEYFSWYFNGFEGSVSSEYSKQFLDKLPNIREYYQMSHHFYIIKDNTTHANSDHIWFIDDMINRVCKFYKDYNWKIVRAKANLQSQVTNSKKEYHNTPHRDLDNDRKHLVIIYYVNDNDGNTFFFDKNLNITKTIESKKGRLLVFNGDIYHTGQHPINSKCRIIINTDLVRDYE